ncbi:MAG: hypothetical protein II992_00345 [Lachnospiraceae bacterium]|nr:hypothetical protein [Lachnospiraceae bacterium]
MRKKVQTILLTGTLALSLFVTGCQKGKNGEEKAGSSYYATEEEITSVKDQLGDDITSGKVWFNGKVLEAPIKVKELQDMGFDFDENTKSQIETLRAGLRVLSAIYMEKPDEDGKGTEKISVNVANPTNKKVNLEDAVISSFRVDSNETGKCILPTGITWKATKEEVDAAYKDAEKYEMETTTSYYYSSEVDGVSTKYYVSFEKQEDGTFELASYGYDINY